MLLMGVERRFIPATLPSSCLSQVQTGYFTESQAAVTKISVGRKESKKESKEKKERKRKIDAVSVTEEAA